eukprot:687838-Alexandrium_andersonii.AAC.1
MARALAGTLAETHSSRARMSVAPSVAALRARDASTEAKRVANPQMGSPRPLQKGPSERAGGEVRGGGSPPGEQRGVQGAAAHRAGAGNAQEALLPLCCYPFGLG